MPELDPEIDVASLRTLLDGPEPPPLVDVREEYEFAQGHVPGAVNLPLTQFVDRVAEVTSLPGDVYLICATGARSGQATDWLRHQGYAVANVVGGTVAWRASGFPLD